MKKRHFIARLSIPLLLLSGLAGFVCFLWGTSHIISGFQIHSTIGIWFAFFLAIIAAPITVFFGPIYALIAWHNWLPLAILWGASIVLMFIGGLVVHFAKVLD